MLAGSESVAATEIGAHGCDNPSAYLESVTPKSLPALMSLRLLNSDEMRLVSGVVAIACSYDVGTPDSCDADRRRWSSCSTSVKRLKWQGNERVSNEVKYHE